MIGGDLDPKLVSFLWGAGGSLGVELIDAYTQLKADPEAKLPLIYKTWYFWLLRIGLTLVAGMLVIAENVVNQPLVEINIGAATPAILRVLTASPPKNPSPGKPAICQVHSDVLDQNAQETSGSIEGRPMLL